jgi:Zn-dependent protease
VTADVEPRKPASSVLCSDCGTEIAASLRSCPRCHRLVHAEALKRLAAEAEAALQAGATARARDAWRSALRLLPEGSRQLERVRARVEELSRQVEAEGPSLPRAESSSQAPTPEPISAPSSVRKIAGALGAAGLLVWKFKVVLGFIVTKGKLLLLGLTKSSTLFSMLLSLGAYWVAFGWIFALGLVASIYVHEMGHVAALSRLGIRASAPMFVPGLGAMVRLKEYPASPREDARVGLAGPVWGLAAAALTYAAFLGTGWPPLAAIARIAAWINILNLIPVWQLDGARGFRALSRSQRWTCVGVTALMWLASAEILLGLVLAVAVFRAFGRDCPEQPDRRTLMEFVLLLVGLSLLCMISVPGVASASR